MAILRREPDALWRNAEEERIKRIRKAALTFLVWDSAGRPIAERRLKRTCLATRSVSALRWQRIGFSPPPNGEKYRETILGCFTKVVMENDSIIENSAGRLWAKANDGPEVSF
jgi:hypothetical protein